jgi:2,4-dienoyl-CoA reductase-like NADH-dependent reductase (Old Yellow Enzyme family)
LHITGNIMIDGRNPERSGNVVVEDESGLAELRTWADTVHAHGTALWGQISHPGRQCPRLVNLHPLAPSRPGAVALARAAGAPRQGFRPGHGPEIRVTRLSLSRLP